MVQVIVSLPIMTVWIFIAIGHDVKFPWWVWIINGVMSSLAAKGIIHICE